METAQMKNRQVRAELADQLRACLAGDADVRDFLAFEADYGLDDEIDNDLRLLLDGLALLGYEVRSGWAPAAAFEDLARETLDELAPQAVATEAAAD